MTADPMYGTMATPRRRMHPAAVLGMVILGMLVGVAGLWVLVVVTQGQRAALINPHVHVLGVDLSGLTVAEAEVRLLEAADRVDAGSAMLTDGETTWSTPWRDLGVTLDVRATALAAYAIGHEPADADPRRWIRTWLAYHPVPPRLGLDVDRTRALLEGLAPTLDRPASAPTVRLEGVSARVHTALMAASAVHAGAVLGAAWFGTDIPAWPGPAPAQWWRSDRC